MLPAYRMFCLLLCLLPGLVGLAIAESMRIHLLPRADAAALVPVIEPLLAPGGNVSAYQGQLIIRTTDSNMAELEGALGSLEATPSGLIVHLRRQGSSTSQRSGVETGVQGRIPGGVSGDIRIRRSEQQVHQQDHYQIRTLSGYPAHISQGTLLALGGGYVGTALAELQQGIQVIPQLTPDGSVVLQISQRFDQPAGNGLAQTQSSASTLRLRPGVWQPMGSITVDRQQSSRNFGGAQRSRQQVNLPLEVMVEKQ